ncbi:hypothetical protein T439DRAFT_325969 [Meredithblackwellia eburnea MCA 4105]
MRDIGSAVNISPTSSPSHTTATNRPAPGSLFPLGSNPALGFSILKLYGSQATYVFWAEEMLHPEAADVAPAEKGKVMRAIV